MVQSETFSMEQSLDSLLLSKTSQDWSLAGKHLLLSADTPSEISTRQLILLLINLENFKQFLRVRAGNNKKQKFIHLRVREGLDQLCIILMKVFINLHKVVFNTPSIEIIHFTLQPKIPSSNIMMDDSKIFSTNSMLKKKKNYSKKRNYGTSIASSMTWQLT